jgi:serine/threonine protein kinase
VCSIGRSEDAEFSIDDTKISRLHCRVESREGRWFVVDLDSRNGTWVGGEKVREKELEDGVTFVLGKSSSVTVKIREAKPAPAGKRVVFPPKKEEAAAPAPIAMPEPLPELHGPLVGLPGTQLGEFRLLEQVASLGPGAFFRALQPSLNRHVLVEVFTEEEISRPGSREELRREVQQAAPLLHPNVLQIFDYGAARGFTYVTMEFFQGRTLARILSDRGFVPIPRALALARQLCEAFGAGIDQRVPVGVSSPGDVWIDAEFTLKAKLFREPGSPPAPVEAFAYQAPEVLAGEDAATPQAAVYTVGAVLYHMLAATPPLTGKSKEEFARRARHDTPPPLRRTNIKVPPILTKIVEQALSKEPADRQDGLREFQRELHRAIAPTL